MWRTSKLVIVSTTVTSAGLRYSTAAAARTAAVRTSACAAGDAGPVEGASRTPGVLCETGVAARSGAARSPEARSPEARAPAPRADARRAATTSAAQGADHFNNMLAPAEMPARQRERQSERRTPLLQALPCPRR